MVPQDVVSPLRELLLVPRHLLVDVGHTRELLRGANVAGLSLFLFPALIHFVDAVLELLVARQNNVTLGSVDGRFLPQSFVPLGYNSESFGIIKSLVV